MPGINGRAQITVAHPPAIVLGEQAEDPVG